MREANLGGYELLDHTADLMVVGHGASQGEALAWVATGMFSVIADLGAVEFDRFDSNFIHCLLGNGGHAMNWFDDELWRIICHNIGAIARVAKQGGCRGILIDPQAYSYSMWSYPILTETSGRTFTYRRGNKAYYGRTDVGRVCSYK